MGRCAVCYVLRVRGTACIRSKKHQTVGPLFLGKKPARGGAARGPRSTCNMATWAAILLLFRFTRLARLCHMADSPRRANRTSPSTTQGEPNATCIVLACQPPGGGLAHIWRFPVLEMASQFASRPLMPRGRPRLSVRETGLWRARSDRGAGAPWRWIGRYGFAEISSTAKAVNASLWNTGHIRAISIQAAASTGLRGRGARSLRARASVIFRASKKYDYANISPVELGSSCQGRVGEVARADIVSCTSTSSTTGRPDVTYLGGRVCRGEPANPDDTINDRSRSDRGAAAVWPNRRTAMGIALADLLRLGACQPSPSGWTFYLTHEWHFTRAQTFTQRDEPNHHGTTISSCFCSIEFQASTNPGYHSPLILSFIFHHSNPVGRPYTKRPQTADHALTSTRRWPCPWAKG